jgi:hypothetical protein
MSRVHYMQDRVKISKRIAHVTRGIVENVTRGLVEDNPTDFPEERIEETDWIPARLRVPAGDEEVIEGGARMNLKIIYELVMYAWDINGDEVCPQQYDELVIQYKRDGEHTGVSARLRITGTIKEVRKRNKLYSYVMPVSIDTEF